MQNQRWITRYLTPLVFGLPVLLILLAVVVSSSQLFWAMGDTQGTLLVHGLGWTLLLLFASNVVALLFLLGWDRMLQLNSATDGD